MYIKKKNQIEKPKGKKIITIDVVAAFQTSLLCIYTPVVMDVNAQSYANRIILCLPSVSVLFYFSSSTCQSLFLYKHFWKAVTLQSKISFVLS